jgi:osmotically-inducible protein OsmY
MDEIRVPLGTTRLPPTEETLFPPTEETGVVEEVARALAASGRFPSARLEVFASEGTVTLRGRVASYYQKQVAQAAALPVIGGRELVNDVEVA